MTKEQREIIGPAVELRQAMAYVERQWRGSHPVLAEAVGMARSVLLLIVNAQLMQIGAAPLKEMDDAQENVGPRHWP